MALPTGRLATGTVRAATGIFQANSIGMGLVPTSLLQIPEGKITATIYSFIRDGRYQDLIKILSNESNANKSRAALSLLGYEELIKLEPDVPEYRLYFAQSLFKAGQYAAAQKACATIDHPPSAQEILKLEAAIRYELEDYAGCKLLIDQAPKDDPETIANQACLMLKEGNYEEACKMYTDVTKIVGFRADIAYDTALCYYYMRDYVPALKNIAEIIERGIREHPELSVGMATEGIEVRSVGNSQLLHQTYLVEAFNLKAAIEYNLKNYDAAREALTDMPPRLEHELDQVTLHNQALMNMDQDPSSGFEKLGFLLQQSPCPQETFGNLLLLYVKYDFLDSAADLLAENQHIAATSISPYLYDFLDATLLKNSAPEEAYKKFDELADKHIDVLRKLTKQVQEARSNHDEETVKRVVLEYDEAVNSYNMVEKIFRKSVEFCNEHDLWKLNVAHVLFMQENKYKEAISFYEPTVKKQYDNILEIPAIVLANLCVAYIMTSQNEEAEDLMRRIEKEEERVAYDDPNKRTYHLCIVNLLGTDTWYYAKRCFASLFETLSKHMIILKDSVFNEILEFLDTCELHGRNIPVVIDPFAPNANQSPTGRGVYDTLLDDTANNVSAEARYLKSLFLKLYE
ncbi:Tetratricopeptide repeat protein 30A [Boothiomyces sp. JEL0838]|nr:Tetratricopeptide repeat protein 30A [Boothiomyces sp. JEL0838]